MSLTPNTFRSELSRGSSSPFEITKKKFFRNDPVDGSKSGGGSDDIEAAKARMKARAEAKSAKEAAARQESMSKREAIKKANEDKIEKSHILKEKMDLIFEWDNLPFKRINLADSMISRFHSHLFSSSTFRLLSKSIEFIPQVVDRAIPFKEPTPFSGTGRKPFYRAGYPYNHLKMFILQFAEAINVGLNEIKPKARIPKNYDLIKYFAERFKLRLTKVLENLKDLINEWQSDTGVDTFIDGFTRSITEGLGANEHPPITRCPVFGQPIFRVNNSDGRVYQEPSNNEIKIYENPNSPWGMIVRGLKSINKSLMDNMETQGKRYEIRETLRGLDYKVFSSFLDTLQEMMNGY